MKFDKFTDVFMTGGICHISICNFNLFEFLATILEKVLFHTFLSLYNVTELLIIYI